MPHGNHRFPKRRLSLFHSKPTYTADREDTDIGLEFIETGIRGWLASLPVKSDGQASELPLFFRCGDVDHPVDTEFVL